MGDWFWIIFPFLMLGGGELVLEVFDGAGVVSLAIAKARKDSKKKQLAAEKKQNAQLRELLATRDPNVSALSEQVRAGTVERAVMADALTRVQAADDAYPQLGHETRAAVDRAMDMYRNSLTTPQAVKGKA